MTVGLNKCLGIKGGADGFTEVLAKCCFDTLRWSREDFDKRWQKSVGKTLRPYEPVIANLLLDEWYDKRDADALYSHPEYFMDPVGGSAFTTKETMSHGVTLLNRNTIQPKSALDVGAGPGFSSIVLAKNFSDCLVYWQDTNPTLEKIFKWFLKYSDCENCIPHVPGGDRAALDNYDLIQAYEIVEHIPHATKHDVGDPMTFFEPIIKGAKWLLHGTMWSAERNWDTLGHFKHYEIDGEVIEAHKCRRPFERALIRRGWDLIDSSWQGRANLYERR